MRTITLQIDDSVIKILEQSDYVSDDEYLRGIEGMIQIIQVARDESIEQSLSLDKLDW
jgi:ribosome-binding protein aMBF1 (putative translation factor)